MKTLIVCALLLAAEPVLADVKPTGIFWLRDSDGIVISVLYPADYEFPLPVYSAGGGVVYMMDGHVLEFTAIPRGGVTLGMTGGTLAAVGAAPTAVVGGTTYEVEVKGQEIWLRDPVTGVLHATERRMASASGGLAVNPQGFALE